MKKYCEFMLCLTLMGCGNGKNISPTSSAIEDLPSITMDANNEKVKSVEQNSFSNMKAIKI